MKGGNKKNTLWIIVGTRPNFIKVTQFRRVAESFPGMEVKIVHTGQHYDEKMAQVFFDQFGLRPDVFLDINSGHPGNQIAEALTGLTELFLREQPDMVMVVGDVNSTLAAAIAANKCDIPIAHLESGLRSNDNTMPEEHNRRVADVLAAIHFITEDSGIENLRREGKPESGLSVVGNTMIDTRVAYEKNILASKICDEIGVAGHPFALVTIHRPSNVDNREGLEMVRKILEELTSRLHVVFPVHPRSTTRMEAWGMRESFEQMERLHMTGPLSYFDFQKLISESVFVLTDSGGIQEETTFLKKPCLTLRPNTERPVTISIGTNTLLSFNLEDIFEKVDQILAGTYKAGAIPPLWDGHATYRVLNRVESFFNTGQ